MKRSLLVLLALALGLSACAPAASGTADEGPAPATAEAAPEETTGEAGLPAVGNLTLNEHAREDDTGYYDTGVWKNPETGEARWVLYRLDYPTGQQSVLWDFGAYNSGMMVSDPFVQGGRVYCEVDDSLCSWPVGGGEQTVFSAAEMVGVGFSDENACYTLASNLYTDIAQPTVQRMDLHTGAVTQWTLPPIYLFATYDCRGDQLLISRMVTDQPLPSVEDGELYTMLLQNATVEYDWMNPVTGALQKIMEWPAAGQTDGQGLTTQWSYRGMGEESLYFLRTVNDAQGKRVEATLERFALDGSQRETVATVEKEHTPFYPVYRGRELAWLLDYDYSGPAGIYEVTQGKNYGNISIQTGDSGWPFLLTRDGRVLVNDHYEDGQPIYGWIDADAYLAGSRDWTLFTEAEN